MASARHLTVLAVIGASLSCGGEPSGPVVRTPTAIALVGGGNQSTQAGVPLSSPLTFRVTDAQGPLPGVLVRFTVEQGLGTVTPGSAFTGETGEVTTTWVLGTSAGALNVLRASVDGTTLSASATAAITPAPAAALVVVAGGGQFAVAGSPLPEPPAVRVTDVFGNPVPNETVTFQVIQGGGSATGTTAVADAQGIARVGGWTLGGAGGLNALRASLGTIAFVDIQAVGTPSALRLVAGEGQSANRGAPVAIAPTVEAVNGNNEPMPGIPVQFVVIEGGGQVTGANVTTGANGRASVGSWTLGPVAGTNRLRASTLGTGPVVFTATAIQVFPAAIQVIPPDQSVALAGNFVSSGFQVRVVDAGGQPVPIEPVVWSVGSGNGQIFGPSGNTGLDGIARLTGWRLGPGAGVQTIQAQVSGLPPAVISVTAVDPPASEYHVVVRYLGEDPGEVVKAAVDSASRFWQTAIIGNLLAVNIENYSPPANSVCGPVNELVDDMIVFVRVQTIDGPGGVLGSAGPCLIRQASGIPVVGGMRLDAADLAVLAQNNNLVAVITHEMAHLLGFTAGIWSLAQQNLISGVGTADPHFLGVSAGRVFDWLRAGGLGYLGPIVPLENVGGAGTVNSHWRETVFTNELMTGFINSGHNPLSPLSITAFRDMGYVVNDAVGEPWPSPLLLGAPGAAPRAGVRIRTAEVVNEVRAVTPDGRIVPVP
jgi:hypothetical protein